MIGKRYGVSGGEKRCLAHLSACGGEAGSSIENAEGSKSSADDDFDLELNRGTEE